MARGLVSRVLLVDGRLPARNLWIPTNVLLHQGEQLLLIAVSEALERVDSQPKRNLCSPLQRRIDGQVGTLLFMHRALLLFLRKSCCRTLPAPAALRVLNGNDSNEASRPAVLPQSAEVNE
jgi:hypothetical protein